MAHPVHLHLGLVLFHNQSPQLTQGRNASIFTVSRPVESNRFSRVNRMEIIFDESKCTTISL